MPRLGREQILAEIRRTAAANGGAPLGVARFLTETGIKESDWSGKFWTRWGDALVEAGFPPNELTRAHGHESLLEQYIALIRDLGRIPVSAELRMKARSSPGFPSHNTFSSRLGTKHAIVTKVLEHCRRRHGAEDVVRLCQSFVDEHASGSGTNDPPSEDTGENFGFVYLIRSGRFHKIGRSNAVGRRERELAIQLPEKASTVHTIRTDDPVGIERYWHQRFEAKRQNGEWFDLAPADVKAFRRRKFM